MVFRAFSLFPLYETNQSDDPEKNQENELQNQALLPRPTDKGFYYKFNCTNEIKLIKYTLEDNGFVP